MNKDISDQLSWKEFLKQSKKNIKVKTVEPFNRLIAHSKNFFLIIYIPLKFALIALFNQSEELFNLSKLLSFIVILISLTKGGYL